MTLDLQRAFREQPAVTPQGAIFSDDGVYRYLLWRPIPLPLLTHDVGRLLAVMINPSDATASANDPTVTRLVDFCDRWGHSSLEVTNLFALCSSDPLALVGHLDPVGPHNDAAILAAVARADRILVAWGDGPKRGFRKQLRERAVSVLRHLPKPLCFRVTQRGHPWHPLYQPSTRTLIPYPGLSD